MLDYRYNLIRYVPDPDRMEPINVGVILQGPGGKVDLRLNSNAAKRGDVDTEAYRGWRRFLEDEIRDDPTPLFQPPRDSAEFTRYLEVLCTGPVFLSRSMLLSAADTRSFDEILASLFDRLVLPPDVAQAEVKRPTGIFRRLAYERRLVDRGMRRHEHIVIGNQSLWSAYRQVVNGEVIAMDKVEVARQMGATYNEIERLPRIARDLAKFVNAKIEDKSTRYYLLADHLDSPFSDQSSREFDLMKRDLDTGLKAIKNAGGEILRETDLVKTLVNDIDARLPKTQGDQAK